MITLLHALIISIVRAQLELHNYERAILLQKSIVAKETNIQNYYDLIGIYHRLGMLNDVHDAANEMLRIDQNNAAAYYVLGAVSGMLGAAAVDSTARRMYDDEALRCFNKSGKLDSNYVLPKIGEALIFAKRNLTDEALKIIKNVEEMAEKDMLADKDYYGLACFYVAAGNSKLALKNLAGSFEKASPSKRAELLETAQIDPDLEPLKSNEEFREIITKYSK